MTILMEAESRQGRDRPLAGRTALVTGSTSGIGLGIARAFAAAGAGIMLNGFGRPDEVEALATALRDEHRVPVAYSGAVPLIPRLMIRCSSSGYSSPAACAADANSSPNAISGFGFASRK